MNCTFGLLSVCLGASPRSFYSFLPTLCVCEFTSAAGETGLQWRRGAKVRQGEPLRGRRLATINMEAGDRLACQISGKGEKRGTKQREINCRGVEEGWGGRGGGRLSGSYDRTGEKKKKEKKKKSSKK